MTVTELLPWLQIATVILGAGVMVGSFRSHMKNDQEWHESIDQRLGNIESVLMSRPAGGSE